MQHLCARLKVDVTADVHTVALCGERFIAGIIVGHQVILDILCRQPHVRRTIAIPFLYALLSRITCHIELSLAASRHNYIGEQHRYKAIVRRVYFISFIFTVSILNVRRIRAFPVGIIVPVECGDVRTLPYQIFRNDFRLYRKLTEARIADITSFFTVLLKVNGKGIVISFLGLEPEVVRLRCLRIKIYFHVVIKLTFVVILLSVQRLYVADRQREFTKPFREILTLICGVVGIDKIYLAIYICRRSRNHTDICCVL